MSANDLCNLFMVSAMYENGGNTIHRMLDGHPEIFTYPFESQLGTSAVSDYLSSFVPFKYRWPEFPLAGDPATDYELFFDEEMKTRLRVPDRSKFRNAALQLDENDRRKAFASRMAGRTRSRGSLVSAFFESTFDAWSNYRRTGNERFYLGYSPVLVLDTEKIFADMPEAHIIHMVRNPYSGYSDTKKRPFPLSLQRYTWTWNVVQHMALTYSEKFPRNFHRVRFEDLVADPEGTMRGLAERLGVSFSESMLHPSWNGEKMESVYPWGTIRVPTTAVNVATKNELSGVEQEEIGRLAGVMMRLLGYEDR